MFVNLIKIKSTKILLNILKRKKRYDIMKSVAEHETLVCKFFD